ncbi:MULTISPECIES: hypothetical protein [Flavobacteriaceae]|jgi:hypothetical protein|uniref:STAS/SEC14 domain-containing protein n=1 Tax=Meridianimaribacter flavus TaxID=571115 RepID=A0ABY2G4I4_9FLAO|nr:MULTISPECIES: hypothetical protein [Meridianimaribacter]TBV25840.1 hypothetical protein DMZ43_07980 [Meridianimaribacter sp. CL38]TDY11207.1 hypothetical protein A8975_1843 [Meridianimaribacter flavus]
MTFENSKYFNLLKHSKVEFSFGNFYLFDKFIISEINEGVHFDWDKIQQVIAALIDYYGSNLKIGYISNRVNPYSIEPQLWIRFQRDYGFIVASAMVSYTELNYINASIEKRFSEMSIKRCGSLDEAINWIKNLKEFK